MKKPAFFLVFFTHLGLLGQGGVQNAQKSVPFDALSREERDNFSSPLVSPQKCHLPVMTERNWKNTIFVVINHRILRTSKKRRLKYFTKRSLVVFWDTANAERRIYTGGKCSRGKVHSHQHTNVIFSLTLRCILFNVYINVYMIVTSMYTYIYKHSPLFVVVHFGLNSHNILYHLKNKPRSFALGSYFVFNVSGFLYVSGDARG